MQLHTIDIPEKDSISLSDIAKLLTKFKIADSDILIIYVNKDLKMSINVGAAKKDEARSVPTNHLHIVINCR